MKPSIPKLLEKYETLYNKSPREASMQWFKEAKFGLFIHYGLYSLLERGEWVQYREKIPIKEYEKLKDEFTAEKFDADFITDLALEAEMKYVNLVTKHCDSFCLWDTKTTYFNSVNSPAKRDLVSEMAEACKKKGLGFFAFYEHGFDWRHAHGPSPWDWARDTVRPKYEPPDPFYATREEYDFNEYLKYVTDHITELCTKYGDLAGIWLDGASIPHSGDKSKFRLPELYSLVRCLQPTALISYKWGVNGDEDFFAPEDTQLKLVKHLTSHSKKTITDCRENVDNTSNTDSMEEDPQKVRVRHQQAVGTKFHLHDKTFSKEKASDNIDLPITEICYTMQESHSWGYDKNSMHLSADQVMEIIDFAASCKANLLLNIGPLGDGSVHKDDVKALREVGRRIRAR